MNFEHNDYVYDPWWGWRKAKMPEEKNRGDLLSLRARPYLDNQGFYARLDADIRAKQARWWVVFWYWLLNLENYAVLKKIWEYCRWKKNLMARSNPKNPEEKGNNQQKTGEPVMEKSSVELGTLCKDKTEEESKRNSEGMVLWSSITEAAKQGWNALKQAAQAFETVTEEVLLSEPGHVQWVQTLGLLKKMEAVTA